MTCISVRTSITEEYHVPYEIVFMQQHAAQADAGDESNSRTSGFSNFSNIFRFPIHLHYIT